MLKVIIVDDELLVRIGIKSCINWEEHGFEVIGHVEDGLKAMELIERQTPDIVITDIKMPNMDGLELIDRLKRDYPDIKVVVLSCFNDFEYVKQAIKQGAEDYILKLSMMPKTLLDILNKIKDKIEAEKENSLKSLILDCEIRGNKYIIREDIYRKFLSGGISNNKFKEDISNLGKPLLHSDNVVLCCGIDDYLNAPIKSKLEDQHLLKFSLINIIEERMSSYFNGDIAEVEKGIFMIIMNIDQSLSEEDVNGLVTNFCKEIEFDLKNYLNISVSYGISGRVHGSAEIKRAYNEACEALSHRFYLGRESFVFYDQAGKFNNRKIYLGYNDEVEMISQLENTDAEKAKSVINRFLDNQCAKGLYKPSNVRTAAVEIFHSIIKLSKQHDMEYELLEHDDGEEYSVETLLNTETLEDIKNWFNGFIDDFVKNLNLIKLKSARPEIQMVKKYISDHIDENITLEMAAKVSNISRCYFSSMFKKYTGESFVDYLNRTKMEKAKELMLKYDMKTSEVSHRVGINDDSYFSKLFKKYIGVSPSKIKDLKI